MSSKIGCICFISVIVQIVYVSSAQNCSSYVFPSGQVFDSCVDLPVLDAHLYWNYVASTKTVQVAYRAAQSSTGWVAWGINPETLGMVGSQAIVGFWNPSGTMSVFTTPLDSYSPSLKPGPLSFGVSNISGVYGNNEMTIFATVGPLENVTGVNHAWQEGSSVSGGVPSPHATSGPNLQSLGKIDFVSS